MTDHRHDLMRDLSLIALSIISAILLVKTGVLDELLSVSREWRFLGSFIAGIFWVSAHAAVPATVTLAKITQANSILTTAFFGGLGALVGDLITFRFVKDHLSKDIVYLIQKSKIERWLSIFRLRIFSWLIPLLGALIIASPLPDELGLIMLGLSKTKTRLFIPISFTLNFLGILAIGLVAKSIL